MRQPRPFLNHASIWRAIDLIARRNGLTASALARKAGLDSTTFNQSKRLTSSGKERWPSTESIAKVLTAAGVTFIDFATLATSPKPRNTSAPAIPVKAVWSADGLEHAQPTTKPRRTPFFRLSATQTRDVFAIRVQDGTLEPICRRDQVLIAAPVVAPAPGMLLALQLQDRPPILAHLEGAAPAHWDIRRLPHGDMQRIAAEEIRWYARILSVEH